MRLFSARDVFARARRLLRRIFDHSLRRRRAPELVVFFIRLPEPVPFPEGAIHTFSLVDEHWPELEGFHVAPADGLSPVEWGGYQFVSLRFWTAERDPMQGIAEDTEAVDEVMRRVLPADLFSQGGDEDSPGDASPTDAHNEDLRAELAEIGLSLDDLDAPEPPTDYVSVVEAVTAIPRPSELDERTLSDAFDRCFERLSDVVQAYRLYSGEPLRRLTYERLPSMIPYAFRSITSPASWKGLSLMILHLNVDAAPERIGKTEMDVMNEYMWTASRGHPFVGFSERTIDARVALERDGLYGEAIIQTQISIEILLDNLLQLMLWEEGTDPVASAETVFSRGLATRVKTQFASRLGGNWDLSGSDPVGHWARHLHVLRGRVVHAGYHATRDEARRAVQAATELEKFIRDRVAAKRRNYPRTTLLFLARPGLERMGLWSGFIRTFAEQADREPDWVASFREWQDRLNTAR